MYILMPWQRDETADNFPILSDGKGDYASIIPCYFGRQIYFIKHCTSTFVAPMDNFVMTMDNLLQLP